MGYHHIDVKRITPNIGAEIRHIDLRDLSDDQAEDIRRVLIARKLIVFRDQILSPYQYADFMRIFGEPVQEDLVTDEGYPPEVGTIHIQENERQTINFWHMDHSFRDKPSSQLSLYAKRLPDCGGDTLFASLEAAYDGLSDAMKARIDGLYTNHKVTPTQNSKRRYSPEQFDAMLAAEPIRHPLVCLNPHNGRKYLFVNVPIYCRSIVDMEHDASDRLLQELYHHAQRPEFQCRVVWQLNTLVVWENSHCLHYPVADYFPQERTLWRVAMPGQERPKAVRE
jgi:taurine dioxygenase